MKTYEFLSRAFTALISIRGAIGEATERTEDPEVLEYLGRAMEHVEYVGDGLHDTLHEMVIRRAQDVETDLDSLRECIGALVNAHAAVGDVVALCPKGSNDAVRRRGRWAVDHNVVAIDALASALVGMIYAESESQPQQGANCPGSEASEGETNV